MICHLCEKDKLSKEFPFEQLTDNCRHPLLHCLQCAIASVKDQGKCSQCDSKVGKDNEKYQDYVDTLEYLYPDIENDDNVVSSEITTFGSKLFISTLSGENTTLSYNPNEPILDLKKRIEVNLKIPSDKQLLLYQEKALKNTNDNMGIQTVRGCNVPPNSKLRLIIVLYAVPEGLDHVIFDLNWGFPDTQTRYSRGDFLDASVFLYNGSHFVEYVDFRRSVSYHANLSVAHSGPAHMDYDLRKGHQKINVRIKSIPPSIDNLIFTLSAYRSPNVSKYRNPSLQFYDEKYPDKMLCTDEMSTVNYSQAIIMCSLSRKGGQWVAKSIKQPSSGNKRDNYSPLKHKIALLILQGVI